tara:strand:+ start:120 stop:278 length:159 start_codon:yes stop_codon:yes gene_type:complete
VDVEEVAEVAEAEDFAAILELEGMRETSPGLNSTAGKLFKGRVKTLVNLLKE